MPARKPQGLNRRHDTAADSEARAANEASLRPARELPMEPPSRLAGMDAARATWRALMREYSSLEAVVATRLDLDLLVDYCVLVEQVSELDLMRKTAYQIWLALSRKHDELAKAGAVDSALELALSVVGAFDAVVKLDGRVDRKRALLLQLRQSLYLTPRARAGVAPTKKAEPEPVDPWEKMLDDVNLDSNESSRK